MRFVGIRREIEAALPTVMELHPVESLIGLSELRQTDPALPARLDFRGQHRRLLDFLAPKDASAELGEGRRTHGDEYRAVIRAAACRESLDLFIPL